MSQPLDWQWVVPVDVDRIFNARVVAPIIRRGMPTTMTASWAAQPNRARGENYERMLKGARR